MDEIFGEVGFAQADLARKEKIERDLGLTALLDGGLHGGDVAGAGRISDSDSQDEAKKDAINASATATADQHIPVIGGGEKTL